MFWVWVDEDIYFFNAPYEAALWLFQFPTFSHHFLISYLLGAGSNRRSLFVHVRVRQYARALLMFTLFAASCSSLRVIRVGLLRFHSALGGLTRRASGGVLLLLLLLLIPRGSIHHSPSSATVKAVWDSLSDRSGDAHLDRRVSLGQLRVEAFRCTSPCPLALTVEIITLVKDNLCVCFLTEWQAQSAFWKPRGKTLLLFQN